MSLIVFVEERGMVVVINSWVNYFICRIEKGFRFDFRWNEGLGYFVFKYGFSY